MKLFCKVGIHLWKKVHDDGINVYKQCRCCRKRTIKEHPKKGYKPADYSWIKGSHEMPLKMGVLRR